MNTVRRHPRRGLLFVSLLLAGALLTPAGAGAWSNPDLIAVLDSDQTVPHEPNNATGLALFKFNKNRTKLRYKIYVVDLDLDGFVTLDNTGDDVTHIHFHAGLPGSAGGHILNIYKLPRQYDKDLSIKPFKGLISGVWDDKDENLVGAPSVRLSDAIGLVCSGLSYVNVHSVDHPTGAIRGQILPESKACERLSQAEEKGGV